MSAGGIVTLEAVVPLDDTLAAIRSAAAAVTVVIVRAGLPALERAMLLAAIGPLAIELAPTRRLCALDVAADAAADAVAGTLRYLEQAGSTTGQVLAIR